ncbi:hypothetical protein EV421DRAFT_569565 [Armillaria borealis]|uniref:Secreted protein n=1 Tax=Armillaria borealis TaxID=47425 RepID=A0AA39JLF5_9AGAR|nr:hypothetical protein EV421DRAFT_569565 [Armillaria borealis]
MQHSFSLLIMSVSLTVGIDVTDAMLVRFRCRYNEGSYHHVLDVVFTAILRVRAYRTVATTVYMTICHVIMDD